MTTPARIAFVTDEQYADLEAEDRVLALCLRGRGHHVSAAVWTDAAVNWAGFDLIVIRTPWDYVKRVGEFNAWLAQVEATGVPVLNPIDVLRWNQDKRYLRRLADNGVAVVPTRWVEPDASGAAPPKLADLLAETGWVEVVLKPVVSSGGRDTYRFKAENAADYQVAYEGIVAASAAMIQPFLPQVLTDGEWTFMYFNGQFSHAVRKQPKAGNFLVQHTQGGSKKLDTPSDSLRKGADAVVAALPDTLLYARIDGMDDNGQFLLMESELLEPYFYTFGNPRIVAGIADAVEARL